MEAASSYMGFGITEAQALFEGYTTSQSESSLIGLVSSVLGLNYLSEECRSARWFINELSMHCYPNESAIKASFVNSIILKQTAQAVSIFELPVGNSRADFCKVNGHSAAYEIKTDLDTFFRLEKQLEDYFDVFDYVYIITSDDRWGSLPDYVPNECGIYSYHQRRDGRYSFTLQRKPKLNRDLNSEKQLNSIPKRFLIKESGFDSRLQKSEIVEYLLRSFDTRAINNMFKAYLKHRYGNRWGYFKSIHHDIFEIDYEWFFHNNLNPAYIY